MHNKNQIIKNILIFITLIVLTFVLIFKDYDLKTTWNVILSVNLKYIIYAIIAMCFNFILEGLNIQNVLNSLGCNTKISSAIKYSLIGFFFSGITPASGGGQPMELYYMHKDNLPITNSTIALLIEACSFHIITIILGIIGYIANYQSLSVEIVWIFTFGLVCKFIILSLTFIALFSPKISTLLLNIFIKILKVIKYHKIDEVKENLTNSLLQYQQGANYIKCHKTIFINSLFIVFLHTISFFSITYFIYRSFDLNTYSIFKIISIQSLLYITVASIPLPGAIGITESAFLKIYTKIFNQNLLPSAMILTRVTNFYLFILISLIVVISSSIKKKPLFSN